jgi:hypothetical protein
VPTLPLYEQSGSDATVPCPECGATVPVVAAGRWVAVHRVGSGEYAYPRGHRDRCSGSLQAVGRPTRREPALSSASP